MFLKSLRVQNVRSLKEKSLFFEQGINLIQGDNAVGKTTLLESIYLLMTGKSFRTAKIQEMIKQKEQHLFIELYFEKTSILQHLKLGIQQEIKKLTLNSTDLTSFSSLLGILQGTILTPQDVELVKGNPSIRRIFLDLQLAQVDPLYVHYLLRYNKAVKQRNFLLKQRQLKTIESFEIPLAQAAAYLVKQRRALIKQLNQHLQFFYQEISDIKQIALIAYQINQMEEDLSSESYLKKYKQLRLKELEAGFTLVGPHKDDIALTINQKPAKIFASEGEIRSLAAALKLAEWQQIKITTEDTPLLLIDDFGLSLDLKRVANLTTLLKSLGQVVITSAQNLSCFDQKLHLISL